jgi:ATP-dependent DNA helicase RecG
MSSPFETLYKMLSQEKNTGFQNKAIIGGVERVPDTWAVNAVTEVGTPEERRLIERLVGMMRRYPSLEVDERATLIEEVLSLISEWIMPDAVSPQATKPPRAVPAPSISVGERESPPVYDLSGLDSSVEKLPGIKGAMAERLANLGVETIGDFLTLYPRRYIDYRHLKTINQLQVGDVVTILGTVWECRLRETRRGRKMVQCTLSDRTGTIQLTWFNQPWLADKYKSGTQLTVSGKVDHYLGRLVFNNPDVEEFDTRQLHTGRIVPVYPLTKGLTQKWLRKVMDQTLHRWAERLPDYMPPEKRKRIGLLAETDATYQIHFPRDPEMLEAARRRLAFDELLFIQLGVLRQRHAWRSQPGRAIPVDEQLMAAFLDSLPYRLTNAQQCALQAILDDTQRSVPMNRLLQGDVGSGKTVVALAAMLTAAGTGGQAALMAPTEILAEQHYNSVAAMLQEMGTQHPAYNYTVKLLTGSTPTKEREEIYERVASGEVQLLIGTHALIQGGLEFQDLRLAVVDEQHRFGVQQRSLLRDKGYNPHVLVMSATPIPRSLALTLYGDLDISIIDELPPGRQEIETYLLQPRERERAYGNIRARVEQGRQAFIICPLVEESENIEAKSAVQEHARLSKEVFPDLKLGLVHGRMKAEEKDAVMQKFRRGELDILVSTAVVEVGIDVPNATVMLVEGANRFGLAQLHQFRGRVGRGEHKSICMLLADVESEEARNRLRVISETSDGFKLAEEDLKMRGPGEFFGTRQSGLPDIQLARLSDIGLLELARSQAREVFDEDPLLESPSLELLRKRVDRFWRAAADPN